MILLTGIKISKMNTIQQQEKTFRVLTGKTVVITGGTSGVGRAAAAEGVFRRDGGKGQQQSGGAGAFADAVRNSRRK